MKLILRDDVANLGRSGDLVEVRDGYGRNFLLPRKLAVMANEKNIRQLEHDRRVITAHQAKLRAAAGDIAAQLARTEVKIARKVGEQDKLYGSVTALDIADALVSKGVKIDRRAISLSEPIKATGTYEVDVRLHSDVTGKVKVEVIPEA
ncbi:MAG TPA: 50S ribosomal protein L9 [Myxococcales bacterium]|jgi:large subunit ribosomal protein L9|nr:50S ribosomal protein L9 [Myxococcales bacterium]